MRSSGFPVHFMPGMRAIRFDFAQGPASRNQRHEDTFLVLYGACGFVLFAFAARRVSSTNKRLLGSDSGRVVACASSFG
eukprot:77159-Rhodomonas_salina.1